MRLTNMIKHIIAVCFSLIFLSGYYFCYIRHFKNKKSATEKNKITPVIKTEVEKEMTKINQPARLILKQRIVRKRIPRATKPTQTADELMAKMNTRHRAILSGDYSVIEPTWKLNSY